MKTWNVHCTCRYSKDYVIEAETEREARLKADAMFGEEDLENLEWVDDNNYDVWKIEDEIQVGDFVKIIDCGCCYPDYHYFFTEQKLDIDIASRYKIGDIPITNKTYKVLYIGNHYLVHQPKIYVIEDTSPINKYVFLINKYGIKKAED